MFKKLNKKMRNVVLFNGASKSTVHNDNRHCILSIWRVSEKFKEFIGLFVHTIDNIIRIMVKRVNSLCFGMQRVSVFSITFIFHVYHMQIYVNEIYCNNFCAGASKIYINLNTILLVIINCLLNILYRIVKNYFHRPKINK